MNDERNWNQLSDSPLWFDALLIFTSSIYKINLNQSSPNYNQSNVLSTIGLMIRITKVYVTPMVLKKYTYGTYKYIYSLIGSLLNTVVKIQLFVSQIIRFETNPKEENSNLFNVAQLHVNLRIIKGLKHTHSKHRPIQAIKCFHHKNHKIEATMMRKYHRAQKRVLFSTSIRE